MDDVRLFEEINGLRNSWNVLPCDIEVGVPIGALYTPCAKISSLPVVEGEPITCKICAGILNHYSVIDYDFRTWKCLFCESKNIFANNHVFMPKQTVEYIQKQPLIPTFIYLIDTCLHPTDFASLKDSILQSFDLLPQNSIVCVYDVSTEYSYYEFNERTQSQITELAQAKFLLPLKDCEMNLITVMDELQVETEPTEARHRYTSCTGVALSVVVSLLECTNTNNAHILMFLGSPCTIGSGKIVGIDRREQIRQLKDLSQNNAPHYIPAKQFYHDIERRLISRGYTLDLFVSSLDQVGVLEMNTCCSSTGGIIVYSDSYSESRFKDSFVRYFENIMFDADIQVHHTSGIKVTDMIGHGITNNIWRSNSISPNTSVAIYFDVDSTTPKQYVQYVSRWRTVDEYRTRVTTHEFIFSNDLEILTSGFDQEAAAVLVVRKTLKTIETQSPQEALCQLDQSIIQITKIFGTMSTNRLQLPNNIVLFPQFMYHFRKTQFLKVLNEEADYLACTRFFINREPTDTCMLLIQPQLTQYDMYGPPHAIALDGSSIRNDAIIMIDSFFVIIINYGNTVVAWRNQDYHHKPGYALFKEFVVSPIEEAKKRIKNRFPCPKLVKRNAQRIYWSASVCTATDFDILPNDGSFKDFMNCLQKIVFKVL